MSYVGVGVGDAGDESFLLIINFYLYWKTFSYITGFHSSSRYRMIVSFE